jgi:hypothetical protein
MKTAVECLRMLVFLIALGLVVFNSLPLAVR